MNVFRFYPASVEEKMVFGAQRPGYNSKDVGDKEVHLWVSFMKERGIARVCCLLSQPELHYYRHSLLEGYEKAFGGGNLCWVPIADYHLCAKSFLQKTILPFLKESDIQNLPVVVHCSGGAGRTGHVLAAWLVGGRKFCIEEALSAVKAMHRNPYEAVEAGKATMQELRDLLTIAPPEHNALDEKTV